MSSITKVLMARSDAERSWYEDQITVNLYARKFLCGNSRVVIVDGGADGMSAVTLGDLVPGGLERLRTRVAAQDGYRLIEGSVLFTARDNPRPFRP